MSAPDHPHGIDAGAYVLSALETDEARFFEAHLAVCGDCRAEVMVLQLVADTLPLAAPQASAPAVLKSRIMAVVNAESELLLAAGPDADRVGSSTAAKPRRRWLPAFSLRPAFAVGLACALLSLGVVGGLVLGSGDPETRTLAAWAKGSADARLVQSGDRASLELVGMPSLSEGRVYQVWFDNGDGQLLPSHTVFNVREDGRARIAIEESVQGVERILVTAEKSAGALAPSADGPVITASPI